MHVNWKTFTCPIIVAMRNLFCMRYSYLMSTGNPHYGYLLDQLGPAAYARFEL